MQMSYQNNLQKTRVLHPILFAIFPIVFLFSINLHTLVLEDILIPLSLVVAATILLWIFLRGVFKSIEKSGLLVSVYLALFFTYGHIFFFINGFEVGDFEIGRHRFLLIIYVALIIIASYYFTKTKRKLVRDSDLDKAIEKFMDKYMTKFIRNNKDYLEHVLERAKSRARFAALKDASKKGKKQKKQRVEKLLDANDIDYDQVLIVDADTIVHPDCPNFFEQTDRKFCAVMNLSLIHI